VVSLKYPVRQQKSEKPLNATSSEALRDRSPHRVTLSVFMSLLSR
jgi:hypothetical protein